MAVDGNTPHAQRALAQLPPDIEANLNEQNLRTVFEIAASDPETQKFATTLEILNYYNRGKCRLVFYPPETLKPKNQ